MKKSPKDPLPLYIDHRKRIKKRYLEAGLTSFHDYEVLELLLTFAINQKDVKPMAKELLARFKSVRGILDAPVEELKTIAGMGEHSAILIKLIRDFSDYYLREKACGRDVISSPADLLNYCRSSMACLKDEHFKVFHLNAKNEIIHDETLQEGTVDQTAVYPRKIIERALKHKAVALIFVHNHPSGSPQPSSHDKNLTRSLMKAAATMDIKVHDHLIIARDGYFSFNEEGLI